MGIFAGVRRRPRAAAGASAPHQPGGGLTRRDVPRAFAAVGEALVAGSDPCTPCDVVGRDLARDGADLGEALNGLRETWLATVGSEPDFIATQALCTAWSEETLDYLHQLSCEDALTGLASTAHLRARIAEVYRESESHGRVAGTAYALLVVDAITAQMGLGDVQGRHDATYDAGFVLALELSRVAESVRSVFSGGETIGRVGRTRLVVLVRRSEGLGRRVLLLRDLIGAPATRIWIEGLPDREPLAARLLDELTRG